MKKIHWKLFSMHSADQFFFCCCCPFSQFRREADKILFMRTKNRPTNRYIEFLQVESINYMTNNIFVNCHFEFRFQQNYSKRLWNNTNQSWFCFPFSMGLNGFLISYYHYFFNFLNLMVSKKFEGSVNENHCDGIADKSKIIIKFPFEWTENMRSTLWTMVKSLHCNMKFWLIANLVYVHFLIVLIANLKILPMPHAKYTGRLVASS